MYWTPQEQAAINILKQTNLRVGMILHEPFAYACAEYDGTVSDKCRYPGLGVEFTKTLCERLKITCQFLILNLTMYGTSAESQLKGAFQQIFDNNIDTLMPTVVETEDRRWNLDFSMPVFYLEAGVMIRTVYTYTSDLLFVVRPFHWTVWLLLLASVVVVALCDAICRYFEPKFPGSQVELSGTFGQLCAFSLMDNMGSLLQRSPRLIPENAPRRALFFTWAIGSLVLCAIYSGYLVSSNVAMQLVLPFHDIATLTHALSTQKYRLMVNVANANFLTQVRDSQSGYYAGLKVALESNKEIKVDNLTTVVDTLTTSPENFAFWSSRFTLRALAKKTCNVTLIDMQSTDMGAYPFRRGSYLANVFSKLILNFNEKGIYLERLEQKYRYSRMCEESLSRASFEAKKDSYFVDIGAIRIVFFGLLVLLSLACGTMVLEVTMEKKINRRIRRVIEHYIHRRMSAPAKRNY